MNVPVSRNPTRTSDAKVMPISAKCRYSCRGRHSQGILKRATTTTHINTLRTCPSCGIRHGPPTQKFCTFPRRYSCPGRDTYGILKRATTTRHNTNLRTCPCRESLTDLRRKSYPISAKCRYSCRSRDSQGILKRATITMHRVHYERAHLAESLTDL